MYSKKCCTCKEVLPETEFSYYDLSKDKLQPNCKKCARDLMIARKAKNPEFHNAAINKAGRKYNKTTAGKLAHAYGSLQNKVMHGNYKSVEKFEQMVGCSYLVFLEHIYGQLKEGMTKENYGFGSGKWSIDHIVPKSAFNMDDSEQVKKCYHYTNCQPLWFIENSRKRKQILVGI